jgi:predicted alpha/beta-fold hydrolase
MGANQLLKYAGEEGKNANVEGICALATPFDIVICSRFLRKHMFLQKLPDKHLVNCMIKVLKTNEDVILHSYEELGIDLEEVYKAERSFEFDSVFTCKLLGYKNPEHYYRDMSCVRLLRKIEKPTLAINSLDDPVVAAECIPYEEFRSNPALALVETRRGGHLGWFTGIRARRVLYR